MKKKLIELMKMDDHTLISTHEQLSFPVVERIAKKMLIGLTFGSISVDENVIINGHHRYLASLLTGYKLDQVAGIKTAAKTSRLEIR